MDNNIAERVEAAIRAVVPTITGVSFGSVSDKSTWKVQPASLQAQAQPVIDAYVEPTPNTLLDRHATRMVDDRALRAVAQALWECIPSPTKTKAQMKARAIELYKSL